MPSGVTIPVTIQVFKGQSLVRTETLTQDVIKIGKLSSSHLQLEDESVSRMHAVIEVAATGEVSIVDLGSTKGTFVNGQRTNKSKLGSGDDVRIGDVRLVVTFATTSGSDATAQVGAAEMGRVTGPRPTVMGAQALQSGAMGLPPSAAAPPPPPSLPMNIPPPHGIPSPFGMPRAAAAAQAPAQVPPHIAEQVEMRDGSTAVEVAAMFEDAVIEVRHLDNPQGGKITPLTKGILGAGGASLFGLLLLFIISYVQVSNFKAAKEAWEKAGKPPQEFKTPHEGPGRDVAAVFLLSLGIVAIGVGLFRLLSERAENEFTIGPDPRATFPAPGDGLPVGLFPLVRSTGDDYEMLFTHVMQGDLQHGGKSTPLQELMSSGLARPSSVISGAYAMSLPQGARVNIRYGENTYNINSVPRPRRYPVPINVDWATQSYTGGVFASVALFLLLIFSVPPDPKSLSLDAFMNDQRMAKFLIKPEEQKPEEIPDWLKKKNEEENSGGKRAKEEVGKMGKKDSKNAKNLFAVKGPPTNTDIKLAKDMARDAALKSGVLGLLRAGNSGAIASIFAKDSALGNNADDVLGGLVGTAVGDAYGGSAFGIMGTGTGGGGTGDGTVGMGSLGTIGRGGGGAGGGNYGAKAGNLRSRKAAAPDVVPGTAEVRGSLDKELIRRIIRRHINEVKFCYEKALTRNPDLQGRVMINFTIGPNGMVVASIVQSSTLGNPEVEQCVAASVRRWEFPKPQGGIVQVTYPFVLKAAGE